MNGPTHLRTQSELRRRYGDCDTCINSITANLVGACASVGIEHKKSTDQMLMEYLSEFHRSGHDPSRFNRR